MKLTGTLSPLSISTNNKTDMVRKRVTLSKDIKVVRGQAGIQNHVVIIVQDLIVQSWLYSIQVNLKIYALK